MNPTIKQAFPILKLYFQKQTQDILVRFITQKARWLRKSLKVGAKSDGMLPIQTLKSDDRITTSVHDVIRTLLETSH